MSALFWLANRRYAETVSSAVIEGIVRDARGAPMAGATVRFKGQAAYVLSDADGRFALRAKESSAVITASLDGYFIAGAAVGTGPITLTLTPLPGEDRNLRLGRSGPQPGRQAQLCQLP